MTIFPRLWLRLFLLCGGALEVKGEEVFEDLFVGEVVGPAVGVEDGAVEGGVDVV